MSKRQHETKEIDWNRVMSAAGPYPLEAFCFVREGLSFTAERVHAGRQIETDLDRHISGQQLCMGLRDFAIDRYGLMAPVVLSHWNIRRTDDFGRIVFGFIALDMMRKQDSDSLEDFKEVYSFDEAFDEPFRNSRSSNGRN